MPAPRSRIPLRSGTAEEVGGRPGPNHVPTRVFIRAPGFSEAQCKKFSGEALLYARRLAPKMSGDGARGLMTFYGDGYFGIEWPPHLDYMWSQEAGTQARTMRELAGKTIPMWIDDPTGTEARKNPKAPKRTTVSGKRQILIFRKVARPGQRKRVAVRDAEGRLIRWRDAPASYPGAPGRIARRNQRGQITSYAPSGHQGVRWRNPGLAPRRFMEQALQQVARRNRIDIKVYVGYRNRHVLDLHTVVDPTRVVNAQPEMP